MASKLAHILLATAGGTSFSARPSMRGSLRVAISLWFFLLMALRRSSACAGLNPPTRRAMAMYCSW